MTRKTFDRVKDSRSRGNLWHTASYLEDRDDRCSRRKSFRLKRSAVRLGARDVQGSLAYAYDSGVGVRPSRRLALHWYRKAWRSGNTGSARNLAIALKMEGRTTSAIDWFRRAISTGDPDARFDLAKILLEAPTHVAEAIRLLKEYVAAGPQEMYEIRADKAGLRTDEAGAPIPMVDPDYGEALLLLEKLQRNYRV